ncbi:MAG: Short chain fatty acids transporter [Hydrogenibacillus schlegelii]|uniref:Short chain fatty acids transporter n=1 Tax=Hydrogenibacillus schlegelii TaxID=1484 RepID=A0A2T5G589_HYDSH|nr:TIGR00366 family protein [Hydrogenibacillus schlegelii]PTQ51354.1 MAG: Short chain fatty acids transporter [Hydrogenibacillus schlegelii]
MSTNHESRRSGTLERIGLRLADWSERWFPDAFVFAMLATLVVMAVALLLGHSPRDVAVSFGGHFWDLVPFTMQMAFIIISGFVVASSPPVYRLITHLSRLPRTAKGAVAFVAFFALLTSLISWGFSLIFSGILIREISRRMKRVDYRALGAAGYLGLGSVWALGLSSSAALMMASPNAIPEALLKISGVIPLSETIFTWQNGVMILVLVALSVAIAYLSAPSEDNAKTARELGIDLGPPANDEPQRFRARTPGEKLETSPILNLLIFIAGIVYIIEQIDQKGPLAALDLNNYNFTFLVLGLFMHWTPRNFIQAVARAVPATTGVLLQFPFYAGIFGVLIGAGVSDLLVRFFLSVSNQGTFPIWMGIYTAILGFFLPSGGGKWVVEAPYFLETAKELHLQLAWVVKIYNVTEALPNLINPFWMLPLMGIMGVRARDLIGYSMLQFLFHVPAVLILIWLLNRTFVIG